jgi:hypothetical protein
MGEVSGDAQARPLTARQIFPFFYLVVVLLALFSQVS